MNIKPFNLEEAKAGKSVCTKDGKPARIICYDKEGEYPIVALVKVALREVVYSYTTTGHYNSSEMPCSDDLIMCSTKRKGWINIYRESPNSNLLSRDCGYIFSTKEEALKAIFTENMENLSYVTTTEIEWEE